MVITSRVLLKNSPKSLYRYLLRECKKLPPGASEFYKHSVTQSFKQHVKETDPDRIQQIMEKALLDAKWVMQKYKKDSSSDPPKK
ncbi:LYR motif-containing protein 9-like [Copidosoma floridanum]|uniref:LYR motif-containing protein 9-like n=1 Tax=Copidosoma floridanum TaxID=29053 RepID=UPI0006C9B1D2|nr:LYR motif-containing protein 9-like [Copidosoma floridanum]